MASKFMAFESVASTSSASLEHDGAGERIEMNSNQYPNYQTNQMASTSNAYGAVNAEAAEEDDLNDNFEEKTEQDVGYRKFLYNNSEQFKSILGGLLLLMGSGVHIVWGIFRVFYLYNCNEENSFYLRLVIWSWYIGAIVGCCCAGYAVVKYRKGHIYAFGGILLTISGLLLMISDNNTNFWLLLSRTIGGYTQGLTYVIVIVHASENATKEFRELLMMIVGAVINYSILVSVLSFFHTEGLFRTGILNGVGLVVFGVVTVMITIKHATETVPFILQTNGSELDALQTMGKLKKRPIAARSVHHDFLLLKNQVQDEIDHYGVPNFRTILLPENRISLIFCCYGRLCSVLSFNLPLIVIIMLFLRNWVDSGTRDQPASKGQCDYLIAYNNGQVEEFWNRTNGAIEQPPNSGEYEQSERVGNSRPKRYTIDESRLFDIERLGEKYLMWITGRDARHKKRDAREKVDENEAKKNEGSEKKGKNEREKERNSEKEDGNDEKKKEEETEKGEKEKKEKEDSEQKEKEKREREKEEREQKEKEERERKERAEREQKEREEREQKEKEQREQKEKEKREREKEERERKERAEREQKAKKEKEEKNRKLSSSKETKNRKEEKEHEEREREEKESAAKVEREKNDREMRERNAMVGTSSTFFAHLIAILRSRELTLILLAWFIFGTITTLILYYFNLKQFIYHISCVLSSVLAFTGLFHSLGFSFLSTIFHITLIIYFNYVTIPIDVFGHCMLAEAFPITLKAFSIASVAIIEHLVHLLLITLYLTAWFHDSTILFMCLVAFVSHEIARNLPKKANLPLSEAHQQYQNIDLMLINEPKSGYSQQQEFI